MDPRIIHFLISDQDRFSKYLAISQNYIKETLQVKWLQDFDLETIRTKSEAAFYQCLWDILSLWNDYSRDTQFMKEFIGQHPEMSYEFSTNIALILEVVLFTTA